MTMTIVTRERVLLRNVRWSTYEALLADMGERGGVRLTYDRGDLEIMSPSPKHERGKSLIGRMVETLTLELGIPVRTAGSTTLRRAFLEKGLEPDECYWVTREAEVRGRDDLDLDVDPPPDLAIEVDITSSSLDRMGIYAALGVPEVWRWDGERIEARGLGSDGRYSAQEKSRCLPFLVVGDLSRFLAARDETDETTWTRRFRDWVRKTFPGELRG